MGAPPAPPVRFDPVSGDMFTPKRRNHRFASTANRMRWHRARRKDYVARITALEAEADGLRGGIVSANAETDRLRRWWQANGLPIG